MGRLAFLIAPPQAACVLLGHEQLARCRRMRELSGPLACLLTDTLERTADQLETALVRRLTWNRKIELIRLIGRESLGEGAANISFLCSGLCAIEVLVGGARRNIL